MIILYFTDFEAVGTEQIEAMLSWMPQQQVELARSMKTLSRQREQAVSYAMLAYALQHDMEQVTREEIVVTPFEATQLLEAIPDPPTWAVAEHGKPYLTNRSGIFFNISHCRESIVTAVSSHEVGIDVEGRRRFSDTLLQRSFNDEEQAIMRNAEDQELEFARIWTRKEAWFKYTGTGILIDHLKSTEKEAADAGCLVDTREVTAPCDKGFFLSIARKQE